jgi:hypothetical protein
MSFPIFVILPLSSFNFHCQIVHISQASTLNTEAAGSFTMTVAINLYTEPEFVHLKMIFSPQAIYSYLNPLALRS